MRRIERLSSSRRKNSSRQRIAHFFQCEEEEGREGEQVEEGEEGVGEVREEGGRTR